MPRANRYFLPGHVWHITHRCHEREFMLKFARDRTRYLHWLFEARKRHGLCVLNYVVTSNHIHLLVRDQGSGEIAQSMQLIAGRTAQQYNVRKQRRGAFWQDRYHATAIETDEHLHRCLVYIDMNMVRAGVVHHPSEWEHGGYRELQNPPARYRIVDLETLSALCGFPDVSRFQSEHRTWVDETVANGRDRQVDQWSKSIAVGSARYIETVRTALGATALHREIVPMDSGHALQEPRSAYAVNFDTKSAGLRAENTVPWNEYDESTYA